VEAGAASSSPLCRWFNVDRFVDRHIVSLPTSATRFIKSGLPTVLLGPAFKHAARAESQDTLTRGSHSTEQSSRAAEAGIWFYFFGGAPVASAALAASAAATAGGAVASFAGGTAVGGLWAPQRRWQRRSSQATR
jgi:hypothetical protein